ncbi:putative integral membrane protein [Polyplosphaeria fusca]|uniref:Integral membrane protein n=1 Tax=Polyplosphaeria fusca TaxID=682080 RepID=A0A9P4UXK9_9PLEO|nr:putative integral membrane protein [Polyplosphaeria fusca]
MRLLTPILATLALLPATLGQTNPSSAQAAALEAMKKAYPTCALQCLAEYIPKSYCPITNTKCICANEELQSQVSVCVAGGCSIPDALTAKNVSSTNCGAPVRDNGAVPYFIGIFGTAFATAFVLARLYLVFTPGGKSPGMDDIFIVAALTKVKKAGLGRDIWTLKPDQITDVLFYYFLGEFGYLEGMGFIKISILCFLLSIFPDKRFRMAVYVIMGLCAAYCITFFFTTLFQCTPITLAWTQWDRLHQGTCRNVHLLGWISAVVNIVLDTAVMALPIKELLGLNMNWKKKLAVISMFLVGAVVLLVSICRLQSLIQFSNSQNITWDYVAASYWSILEVDIGIICACMPAVRGLLLRSFPNMFSTGTNKGSSNRYSSQRSGKSRKSISKEQRVNIDTSNFIPLVDREGNQSKTSHRNDV